MAGGKETPRQKMIGMMYLVLTALLALQVSSAVLEKFAIINETMVTFKEETNKKNAATLNEIVKEAGKSPNSKVVKARENAQKVRELTQTTLAGIEKLKGEIMKLSGQEYVDEYARKPRRASNRGAATALAEAVEEGEDAVLDASDVLDPGDLFEAS